MLDSNHDWERKILVRILLDESLLKNPSFASLEPHDFQDARNLTIFAAMKVFQEENRPIRLVPLADYLKEHNKFILAGGEEYLLSLAALGVEVGWAGVEADKKGE